MNYTTNLALALASMFLIVLPARADVPPPETAPCSGKQAGAACTYNGAAGLCRNGTCSRLDYANWDRDASASPPSTTYACVKCDTASATATATRTDTDTDTGSTTATDTATATSTPTATVTVTVTATTTTTATATNPPTDTTTTSNTATGTGTKDEEPPADDDGACSIGRSITAKRMAPWVLAASFSLLFLFARRRRR